MSRVLKAGPWGQYHVPEPLTAISKFLTNVLEEEENLPADEWCSENSAFPADVLGGGGGEEEMGNK